MFCFIFFGSWELCHRMEVLSPTFFGSPFGIINFLSEGFFVKAALWKDIGYTLFGTVVSFLIGTSLALTIALIFLTYPRIERASEPYLTVFNAMPRIALAPLFLLWFGLGLGSKIAVGSSLSFFIVLSSAVAGMRSVSPDHLTLSRTLGATPTQIFFKLTIPTAIPTLFSGLRLGLIYSMLGVIGSELIAAEHGIGQQLSFLQSMFNMNGVMGLIGLLAAIGMLLTKAMTAIERRLLVWQ
ncbi:MAG: ABC transporter permease [Betaproteobacteria bacterium]|nr:ABC transporter permease [Betaproteobacteria bacterium]NDC03750.1 ABC transporter permease [Betaproteobacteria bacterium]NDC86417.1 ABC transporter permease [Betaproteobacteria bacterium]NDG82791.1 ABC transporter permease [Betaproteobacteria bacterium]